MKNEKEVILSIQNLKMAFKTDYGDLPILGGISFDIHSGEALGIVGESGCGKSVTSLCVMRLLTTAPHKIEGKILFHGKDINSCSERDMRKIRGNKISMIFQEPMTSLNPTFTIGYQLTETLMLHQGLSKKEARVKAIEMLNRVRIADPEQRMNEYPHELSGGMRQRVMIAMALICRPELLIADEPTTALDVTIQAQVLELMRELQREMGSAVMFITHDLGVIRKMCERVVVLYCGEMMETAPVEELFHEPAHPYTKGLLNTLPKYGVPGELPTIPGMVPPAGHFPEGCVFAPRCPHATERCLHEKPSTVHLNESHTVRCFLYEDKGE